MIQNILWNRPEVENEKHSTYCRIGNQMQGIKATLDKFGHKSRKNIAFAKNELGNEKVYSSQNGTSNNFQQSHNSKYHTKISLKITNFVKIYISLSMN